MTSFRLFATTPKALEAVAAEELKQLGAENIKQTVAGASFDGSLETAYRACLWSRCANRILFHLQDFEVNTQDDLYRGIKNINWFEHLAPTGSFAVSFSTKSSVAINNSHFGALKVKDAVVDQMRAKFGKRPSIDTDRPDIRINVYLSRSHARVSLDLSGESLHRRGYRDQRVPAPIKENLAASMLLLSGWPEIAALKGSLIDPMCGSGTLLLEGAMIAADYAPGLLRDYFGFLGWKRHDADLWLTLREEAERRLAQGLENMPVIAGFDRHRRAVNAAQSHVEKAGLAGRIHLERRDIGEAAPALSWRPGLVISNPPYGERLGDETQAAELYRQFGEVLKERFNGWRGALIIGDPELGFRLGIRSQKPLTLYNGALECKLLRMDIEPSAFFVPKPKTQQERALQVSGQSEQLAFTDDADMFANRLKKNLKKMSGWAKRNGVTCYRVYDADLPEFAVAVDLYRSDETWVNVQEYEAPKSVDPRKADRRLASALAAIPMILETDSRHVFLKIRRKQKQSDQYEKYREPESFHTVEENGCRLLVNFESYLDTGLFLDHRPIRQMIQRQAKGKTFLNLFAYTGSASVNAAKGGATKTVSVDMSKTYLDWAKKNMALNHTGGNHEFIQADCLEWLERESQHPSARFDLIFLDPPTFSNSKRMEMVFDVQRDHVRLIDRAASLLAPGGILYFSTNFRRFKMDRESLPNLRLEDISAQTIPEDFARNPKIHYCWRITR
ncbi:MAG: bifunctional 23S rRNA (guanine(2069)-N(7))-methyltransferase RlmK/23S rRNA (guanine(2445)-N(2))-methyltransferase RlmL [Gammaproteobacteria bacterium]